MKKTILSLMIFIAILNNFSCSSSDDSKKPPTNTTTPVSFNKLKAYDKIIAYYYYSPDATRNGISRIYLDTVSNIITEYTSHRDTNQNDTSEYFGIKTSTKYTNYENTNIDYISYEVISYGVNGGVADMKNAPAIIMFSHATNTDKFNFERFKTQPEIIVSNNFNNTEYYKKMYK
jgi:hypothetical protein